MDYGSYEAEDFMMDDLSGTIAWEETKRQPLLGRMDPEQPR